MNNDQILALYEAEEGVNVSADRAGHLVYKNLAKRGLMTMSVPRRYARDVSSISYGITDEGRRVLREYENNSEEKF